MQPRVTNPIKAWLAEFHLVRELFKGPNGKPLYTYQVTSEEFIDLRGRLAECRQYVTHPTHEATWAAGFCVFIAECYRREYDGSQGWAWESFEKRLGCSFSQSQRSRLVTRGLEGYWKRPIRPREKGRDLLGSLFFEGGLPWPLLQRKDNGFGRAVTMGLQHYYRTEDSLLTTSDLVEEYERYLPQSFQNLDTRQLIAGVIEQLMHLVQQHPIKGQTDPASYLDKFAPGWQAEFPLPLDQENARKLVNGWLKSAEERREARHQEGEKARELTCDHRLSGDLPKWRIQTALVLPRETTVKIDTEQLSTTRLELGFFEGKRLVALGGAVYGRIEDEGLKIRFPETRIPLTRSNPGGVVSMRLMESGRSVYRFLFDSSQLNPLEAPWIFHARGDEWWMAASASCSLATDRVRIRIPVGFDILSGDTKTLAQEDEGALWVEARDNVTLSGLGDHYHIRLKQAVIRKAVLRLSGSFAPWESKPSTVYQGWPRLEVPDDGHYQLAGLIQFVNGKSFTANQPVDCAGVVDYRVKSDDGSTILRRKFGVLPKDFRIALKPASNSRPARLKVSSSHPLNLNVVGADIRVSRIQAERDAEELYLQHTSTNHPATFILEVGGGPRIKPVRLRLPYPFEGARLVNTDGEPSEKRTLLLDELLGMRLELFPGYIHDQAFNLQLKLISCRSQRLERNYTIKVGRDPITRDLFGYHDDMMQMFSAVAVDEQDAYIQLSLQSTEPLVSLIIRRYNAHVQPLDDDRIVLSDMAGSEVLQGARVESMQLSDPKKSPLQLKELTSEGVGTGCFILDSRMDQKSPWLIYPGEESAVKFRPYVYPGRLENRTSISEVKSLHKATQLYDSDNNVTVIGDQITAMARNYDHSGWQYLADLKSGFIHLPLSTFEGWLALSRNPAALASAVFRLEMDETFCNRLRDELAVVWESIPLPLWVEIYDSFRTWLREKGFQAVLVNSLLANRKAVLPEVVSGFAYVDRYMETGATNNLAVAPIEIVLPDWYQDLRRHHSADDNWPNVFGPELRAWIKRNTLPASIRNLSLSKDTDAITYLPIFMAYVTAGQATLDQLEVDLVELKFAIRLLSDFDRQGWYACVHSMMVSYLLAQKATT